MDKDNDVAGTVAKDDPLNGLFEELRLNLALAQDGPSSLPPQIREQGNEAIDAVAAYVCSCFPNNGVNQSLREHEEWKKLQGLFSQGVDKNTDSLLENELTFDPQLSDDVAGLVAEVVRCAKRNPILVAMGAAWKVGLTDEEKVACFPKSILSEERRQEVQHATVYTYLLHTIAYTYLQEAKGTGENTTFLEKIHDQFSKQKEILEWKPYFSAFGRAKETTIEMPIKGKIIPFKNGTKKIGEKHDRGALVAVNILEAMMQDTLKGYDDNARCGFELMMEPNDREEIAGTGNGPDREWIEKDIETGVPLYLSPLPIVWNNLYSSWNLCFCTNYPNYPIFFAKLFNPATFGMYHDVLGLYLSPRIVTLYVQIQYTVITRAAAKNPDPPFGEWRSSTLTGLWGRVNREAAEEYQKRIESIVDENSQLPAQKAYHIKRTAVRPLWGIIQTMIKAYRSTRKEDLDVGKEDEEAVELFEKVKRKSAILIGLPEEFEEA